MYPRQFSIIKSLITAGVLMLFSYVIVQANQIQTQDPTYQVPHRFVATDDSSSALIELNELDLIPVEVSDGVRKHSVRRGESLLSIAAHYGTTVAKIKETNNIQSNTLSVGQELYISEVSGIIHTLDENTNFLLFANKYNLPLEDVLTLNYARQEELPLYADTEIFLPITIEKAYELGLETKPEPIPEPIVKPKPVVAYVPPKPVAKPVQEKVVPEPALIKKVVQPASVITEVPAPKPTPVTCRADQCVHDNRCYDKPEFAVCAPEDTQNARVCVSDYVDTGSACVSQEELKKQKNNIYAGKIVATRYDNSTRVSNGFYIGQCTYWAAKRRPDIFPYISATSQSRPFRGNANAWLRNAQAAGLATGTNPTVGSIAVDLHGGGGYGHVAIIKEVRADLGLVLIEDMNGVSGRGYVDHRWESISKFEGYIY